MLLENLQAEFGFFVDFLVCHKDSLLRSPFNGDLERIRLVLGTQNEACLDLRDSLGFTRYLKVFNSISANALEFTDSKLTWIKLANVLLLQTRLSSTNALGDWLHVNTVFPRDAKESTTTKEKLMSLLDSGPRTAGRVQLEGEGGFDYDLDRLNEMLSRETAMVTLGIQRARLLANRKPFFQVCENQEHITALSAICFGSKAQGGSNELPSNAKLHKMIASCKATLHHEIGVCLNTNIHFLPLITNYTDRSLGNCSYLDTCHKLKSCRYVHYYTLHPGCLPEEREKSVRELLLALDYTIGECHDTISRKITPPQWINCDVRNLPFSILGKKLQPSSQIRPGIYTCRFPMEPAKMVSFFLSR